MNAGEDRYLPDREDWGDVPERLRQLITVPIFRVPWKPITDPDNIPFERLVCSWHHLDWSPPLTKETFNEQLEGALRSLADSINGAGAFRAYPIGQKPRTSYAIAYHDWGGPFDVRGVIQFDSGIVYDATGDVAPGLKFHLCTLLGRP